MNDHHDEISARLRSSLNASTPELSADIVTGAAARPAPHTVNRGGRVQLASGVTLAVAAAAVTALVISPSLTPAPLFTAAGSNSGSSPMAANEDATSDLRIANWVNYEYVAGEGLSTDGASGHVYQLQRVGTAEQVLKDAADAFNLDGEPHKASYFDPAYPTYVIGSDDGTAPSVTVSWMGTGDWWYSDPSAYPAVVCEPAPDGTVVGGDAVADEICTTPEVTENLAPSEGEARSQAADIFETTGLDVDESDIRVVADEWQTSASASLVVDGEQTGLEWVVSWSPSGVISWAYGHSIDVVDKGDFGTISPAAAIERIADGRWWGQAGPEYQGGMTTFANDSARAAELGAIAETPTEDTPEETPVEPTDKPTEDPGVDPDQPVEPAPDGGGEQPSDPGVDPDQPVEPVDPGLEPEPLPVPEEPETVILTVEEAFETLLLVWDTDGNAWLVPGFVVQNPEGWFVTIVSLVEGVIALPEPMQIEPYTLEEDLIRE